MQTIVTGGAGFIGSHIVDALLAQGDGVTVVDDISTGRRQNLGAALETGVRLEEFDIRDAEALYELFDDVSPEVVFHVAAQIDVRRSVSDPRFDSEVNVGGSINVLEASRRAGARRVVFSSTGGALYGDASTIPSPEHTPVAPLAPYGLSKACAEGYCSLYERLHGLSAVSLRYGNVYGPRQDPLGEAGVIAIFCNRLATGERPIVYGDGKQTRDYVFVADVVDANLRAAQASVGGAFNIGTGVETSVLELVEAIARHGGAESFDPIFEQRRPGEVDRSCLDSSRARDDLGWRARTDIDRGIEITLESNT